MEEESKIDESLDRNNPGDPMPHTSWICCKSSPKEEEDISNRDSNISESDVDSNISESDVDSSSSGYSR